MFLLNWKTVLLASGSAALCGVAYRAVKKKLQKVKSVAVNEILFYGTGNEVQQTLTGVGNQKCISHLIHRANHTVDICIPNLNNEDIVTCLLELHKKMKVVIRIMVRDRSEPNVLQKAGITIKTLDEELEYQFILVDAVGEFEETVALIGSLENSGQQVNCNRDSTLVTSEFTVVSALKSEFDRIWASSYNWRGSLLTERFID